MCCVPFGMSAFISVIVLWLNIRALTTTEWGFQGYVIAQPLQGTMWEIMLHMGTSILPGVVHEETLGPSFVLLASSRRGLDK